MITDKQQKILNFIIENREITKIEAIQLIGSSYYCNASKHVGDILSRMVKSGLINRVKNGLFCLGGDNRLKNIKQPENQLQLFKNE